MDDALSRRSSDEDAVLSALSLSRWSRAMLSELRRAVEKEGSSLCRREVAGILLSVVDVDWRVNMSADVTLARRRKTEEEEEGGSASPPLGDPTDGEGGESLRLAAVLRELVLPSALLMVLMELLLLFVRFIEGVSVLGCEASEEKDDLCTL